MHNSFLYKQNFLRINQHFDGHRVTGGGDHNMFKTAEQLEIEHKIAILIARGSKQNMVKIRILRRQLNKLKNTEFKLVKAASIRQGKRDILSYVDLQKQRKRFLAKKINLLKEIEDIELTLRTAVDSIENNIRAVDRCTVIREAIFNYESKIAIIDSKSTKIETYVKSKDSEAEIIRLYQNIYNLEDDISKSNDTLRLLTKMKSRSSNTVPKSYFTDIKKDENKNNNHIQQYKKRINLLRGKTVFPILRSNTPPRSLATRSLAPRSLAPPQPQLLSRFNRVDCGGAGDCFFRCIAFGIFGDPEQHDVVRQGTVQQLCENLDNFRAALVVTERDEEIEVNEYIARMRSPGTFIQGDIEIINTVNRFDINLVIHTPGRPTRIFQPYINYEAYDEHSHGGLIVLHLLCNQVHYIVLTPK